MDKKKRIVVTGMGVVSCFGNDVDEFYNALLAGKSGIKKIDTFDCEEMPTQIAGLVPDFDTGEYLDKKQARRVDACIRYGIVAGKKALESAKLTGEALEAVNKDRAGILLGSGMGGMQTFHNGVENLVQQGFKKVNPFFVPYIITNMPGGLLAMDLGFMGPNYSISTACATGNYCIYAAANHIRNGEADIMVCGGTEAGAVPIGLAGFIACKALSKRNDEPQKASRPWDKNRDGFVLGEGAGVLILESLEHAEKRGAPIIAEYLGGAVSCDAFHMTNPRDDGKGLELCMNNAMKDAGIDKSEVDYVNAHGTSTPAGDMIEYRAVKKFFGDTDHMKMNSTKSMTGHALGAAAGIEAVATLKAIQEDKVHPTINVEDVEDEVDMDLVLSGAQDHKVNVAMNNSFGFGGHNSCILFKKYQK